MFPDAASSNPAIFYHEGRALSVAEVYSRLTGGGAESAPVVRSTETDGQFVQYASARRADRMEQQRELMDLILRGPESPGGGGEHSGGGLANAMFSSEMLRVLSEANQSRG